VNAMQADPPAFGGHDQDRAVHAAICSATPTKCQARTRLYRGGVLETEGFPVDDISEYLKDPTAVVWLDLRDPDREDLGVLQAEFGLHPLAVAGAVTELAAGYLIERRLGPVAEPYQQGEAGELMLAARVLTATGAAASMAARGRSRFLSMTAGATLVAASAVTRFSVFRAGRASARDPKHTIVPQRTRAAARAWPPRGQDAAGHHGW